MEKRSLVMEYVDGPTLDAYMQRWRGQLPYEEIALIFDGVLQAIGEAHQRGIVHRDLKPQNILLRIARGELVPKVADFGLAKVLEGTTYTRTGALLGTYRYMSPEQAQSSEIVDPRSDIYTLGVVLYRAVTGRCPFESNNPFAVMMAHVEQAPAAPSHYRPGLSSDLEGVILDALAKDPAARPASCEEFAERLQRAVRGVAKSAAATGEGARLDSVIREADGHELVLIPAGLFQYGPNRREVYVGDYYIARFPVTNKQFQLFLDVTGYEPDDDERDRFLAHWRGRRCPVRYEDHPVVFVSWIDANAYCAWAGRRLPTDAEWEKAARGSDGRKYPWGKAEPTDEHANYGRRHGGTLPIKPNRRGTSPYGIEAMAGNIWEWCEDADDPSFFQHGPERNPRNTVQPDDARCVVRGGSWMYDARSLRTYARSSFAPTFRVDGVGFRVAM